MLSTLRPSTTGDDPTLGETTATNTQSLLRARVLPEFEAKQLKQITTPDVRLWLAAMTEEGLSDFTVHTYRKVLAQVLDQAVDDGVIVSNPAKKAKAPSVRPRRQLFLAASELRDLADERGDYAPSEPAAENRRSYALLLVESMRLRAAIEARAKADHTTTSEIIREALRRFLDVA